MNKYLLMIAGLVVAGCSKQTPDQIIAEVNATGKITDVQAESLTLSTSPNTLLELNGLTSITDAQAENLSRLKGLSLNGLTMSRRWHKRKSGAADGNRTALGQISEESTG